MAGSAPNFRVIYQLYGKCLALTNGWSDPTNTDLKNVKKESHISIKSRESELREGEKFRNKNAYGENF